MLTIDPQRSLLLVVDFQSRLMPAIHEGETSLPNAGRLIEAAKLVGVPSCSPSRTPRAWPPRFFAVSSYKGDKVWYDRCNFSSGLIHCVLINYPANEERDWDDIVTRISLSLRGR